MPDFYFDVDVALTEVPVNLLPLLDDTDFKTRETAVAYNAAGMNLVWNFVTSAGAFTQTAVTPTTAGTYDWTHQGGGIYTIEIPASAGASINNDTEGYGWFTGIATGVLPWRGPTIGFRAAALNDSLCDAGTTGLLGPTTAGRTLDVSAGGEAGMDWANVGTPGSTVSLSATTISTLTTYTGNTPQTGDAFARLGAPAGASVSADLLAIDNFVDDLESRIGTPSNLGSGATLAANLADIEAQTDDIGVAGAGLTNIGTIATVTNLTNLPTIPANWLTAAGLATDAVTEIQSGLSTLTQANVRTAVGLASANLDTQLDALPTAAENAGAVWDEATSGHATAGTYGQAMAIIRANTAQAGASTTITLDASASATDNFYNNTFIFITGGTGAGQSRIISAYVGSTKVATVSAWAVTPSSDSVFVILPFGAIPGATAPTAAEVADAVWDEATAGHTTAGSTGKALTDAGSAGDPWSTALPGAYGAGTAGKIIGDNINAAISSRASQASLDTLDDYVDTEVAAIKAKTDQLTFTVANQLDANIQSVNDVTVNGNGQTGTEWGP